MACSSLPERTVRQPADAGEGNSGRFVERICNTKNIHGLAEARQARMKYGELLHEASEKMDERIYSEERKRKILGIFVKAREAMARYLKSGAKLNPSSQWEEMISRVEATQLKLSVRAGTAAPAEYGAHVLSVSAAGTEILLPGIALLVDSAPDAILFLLLHELSHAIDPGKYPVSLAGASSSVWSNVVRCLRKPTSVGARTGDPLCFRKASEDSRKLAVIRNFCEKMADGLELNPDFGLSGPSCGCAMAQGAEAFADWLATEVIASMHDMDLLGILAWPCSAYLDEMELYAEIAKSPVNPVRVSYYSMGSHPAWPARIVKIMLANPALLEQLEPQLRGLPDPKPQYCSTL